MFTLNQRWVIDGWPRWNVARYINHSCRPNAKPVGRRDEEITYDYGRDYLKSFLAEGGCRCAACRGKRVGARDHDLVVTEPLDSDAPERRTLDFDLGQR